MAIPWSTEDRRALMEGIGVCGWAWLQARTGKSWDLPGVRCRSKGAIREKVRREVGSGGITRGSLSLRQVMGQTGYGRTQLLRAARALNQRWKRTATGGVFLILEDQVQDMIGWLAHDYWGSKVYGCAWCGEPRGQARLGLCVACYHRYRRKLRGLGLPGVLGDLLSRVCAFTERRGLSNDDEWGLLLTRLHKGLAPLPRQLELLRGV